MKVYRNRKFILYYTNIWRTNWQESKTIRFIELFTIIIKIITQIIYYIKKVLYNYSLNYF